MIEAVREVIIDLFRFVFPVSVKTTHVSLPAPVSETKTAIQSIPQRTAQKALATGETAYIIKTRSTCFLRPILAFDTRLGFFSFGDVVNVALLEGQFAYVTTEILSGWIDISDLSYHKDEVFPQLVSKTRYTADDKETVMIRQWLKDECDGGTLYLPLQSAEYILYRLNVRKINIEWPTTRPRTPGVWQTILKGKPRVHISVDPKTASVMEYYRDDKRGVLAFVESVHPDESIVVQSVSKEIEGEFSTETLTQAQWRELRPVFISFT